MKDPYFEFTEGGLHYRAPNGRETQLAWDDLRGIRKSPFCSKLYIFGRGAKIPLSPLDSKLKKDFLLSFFSRWRNHAPEQAKKAAFDYVDEQKGLTAVVLALSFFFAFPFAFVLLQDSYELTSCSRELKKDPVNTVAQVLKMKRKPDGPYLLDLQFTANGGQVIRGKDQFLSTDKEALPNELPLVYSRSNPSCWSLTPSPRSREVNWAKRHFFAVYTLLFGGFFLLCGFIGALWGFARRLEKRPYLKEVSELFSFQ